jgi:hypothetical protein
MICILLIAAALFLAASAAFYNSPTDAIATNVGTFEYSTSKKIG